jgi:surface protein
MSNMFYGAAGLTSLNTSNWNLGLASGSTAVFTNANAGIVVTCNQGGSPGTGTFFGKTCN